MARVRVSTTVDGELLEEARRRSETETDSMLLEEALGLLVAERRAEEIDAQYAAAYDKHPIDEPDAWGDLASFSEAIAKHGR